MTRVVLTGPTRGIGRACAAIFSRREVDLVLLGRDESALRSLSSELGAGASCASCDLADANAVQRAAMDIAADGDVDVLVNNAAVIHRESVEQATLTHFEEQVAVNLRAPFLLSRAFLAQMRQRKSGRIIHVASISATLGTARSAIYNATKWGLVGFMKSLAEELRDSGVVTLAVLPGSVDTRMLEGSGFTPRMTAADVAQTIVHYALDAPAAHNGATIEMFGV